MNRSAVIAKCPACGAKTKVTVDADRVSIRCPRCKADVPLVHAAAYVTPASNNPSVDNSATKLNGETTAPSPPPTVSSSKKRQTKAGPAEFQYPDHSSRFIRAVMLAAGLLTMLALVVMVYLAWTGHTAGRYQEYLNNLRETIAACEKCREMVQRGFDPTDVDKQREYEATKGRIEYLLTLRKRLVAPPENESTALQEEDRLARQQLDAAERVAGLKRPAITTPPGSPAVDSSALGQSILQGPRPAPSERAQTLAPPKAEPDSVLVSLPGVTKVQVTTELLRLFSDLADSQPALTTPTWAGDLVTIQIKPVRNPAQYATKIRFGRVIYYSSTDRALTVQLGEEQRAQPHDPARDPLAVVIGKLNQRSEPKKILEALESLRGKKPLDRQAEIAASLEAVATHAELDQITREAAVKLLPTWAGRDCIPILEKLLDDRSSVIAWAALDALSEIKAVASADVMARKWTKLEPSRVTRALIALGPDIEKVVLPYLHNTTHNLIKVEVCRVLQEVGTAQSLKPLLDVINDKEQTQLVVDAAKEAMKHILDRK
jgi:hypothetical protein